MKRATAVVRLSFSERDRLVRVPLIPSEPIEFTLPNGGVVRVEHDGSALGISVANGALHIEGVASNHVLVRAETYVLRQERRAREAAEEADGNA